MFCHLSFGSRIWLPAQLVPRRLRPRSWFDCETEAVHDGGDHVILIGRVNELRHDPEGDPLLYYRGRYSAVE